MGETNAIKGGRPNLCKLTDTFNPIMAIVIYLLSWTATLDHTAKKNRVFDSLTRRTDAQLLIRS